MQKRGEFTEILRCAAFFFLLACRRAVMCCDVAVGISGDKMCLEGIYGFVRLIPDTITDVGEWVRDFLAAREFSIFAICLCTWEYALYLCSGRQYFCKCEPLLSYVRHGVDARTPKQTMDMFRPISFRGNSKQEAGHQSQHSYIQVKDH